MKKRTPEGAALTVAQIVRRIGLTRQAAQRIVNDLEKLGMVVMDANIDHKRASLVSISEQGAEANRKVDRAQIAWVNQLSDGLSERQIKQAIKVIEAVRKRARELDI